jgi:four helix bundle protein
VGRFQGDLPERTYAFGLAIMGLVDHLPVVPKAWHLSSQLLRSGTSVGANVEEADAALTRREFVMFCNIARRESKETMYWMKMARDSELISNDHVVELLKEADEILRILTTIVIECRRDDNNNR